MCGVRLLRFLNCLIYSSILLFLNTPKHHDRFEDSNYVFCSGGFTLGPGGTGPPKFLEYYYYAGPVIDHSYNNIRRKCNSALLQVHLLNVWLNWVQRTWNVDLTVRLYGCSTMSSLWFESITDIEPNCTDCFDVTIFRFGVEFLLDPKLFPSEFL